MRRRDCRRRAHSRATSPPNFADQTECGQRTSGIQFLNSLSLMVRAETWALPEVEEWLLPVEDFFRAVDCFLSHVDRSAPILVVGGGFSRTAVALSHRGFSKITVTDVDSVALAAQERLAASDAAPDASITVVKDDILDTALPHGSFCAVIDKGTTDVFLRGRRAPSAARAWRSVSLLLSPDGVAVVASMVFGRPWRVALAPLAPRVPLCAAVDAPFLVARQRRRAAASGLTRSVAILAVLPAGHPAAATPPGGWRDVRGVDDEDWPCGAAGYD